MENNRIIGGIHHITAICSSPAVNVDFYEKVLGLKLVKQTVNFDDPYTYHLYYGDENGNPGTILTFFPWDGAPKGKTGKGTVSAIGFSIPVESIDYWHERLVRHQLNVTQISRFGDTILTFCDPDGLQLELAGSKTAIHFSDEQKSSPDLKNRIRGFHSATALVNSLDPSKRVLQDIMAMELVDIERNRYRFRMASGELSDEIQFGIFYDLVVDPVIVNARQGKGIVHHIAFRAESDEEQAHWQRVLDQEGIGVTAIRDRKYFKSIYFHEPGGVLFEIATDGPGFDVDEPSNRLGKSLMLPPQYESMRSDIENRLPALRVPEFAHRFIRAGKSNDSEFTIVALHGTGGNEYDLIPLAERICSGSTIISPRGKVKEGGMNRYFKRLAPGLFDEQDIVSRSEELADFLKAASKKYGRRPDKLIALGYSNGANIAAANILLQPGIFESAILFRPMLPLSSPPNIDLAGKEILILRGNNDSMIPAESTERLISILRNNGANVQVQDITAGHALTQDDMEIAARWFADRIKIEPAL